VAGLLAAFLALPLALHAQFEVSGSTFNRLFQPSAPPAQIATQPQFAGEVANASGSAARADVASHALRYPSSANGIVITRAGVGSAFAAGVPRYMLGDTIVPPATQVGTNVAAAADYWRAEPVRPGETFSHPAGSPETPLAANASLSYYFSPHARRVFASQSGRVSVKWVTRLPVSTPTDPTLRYRFVDEVFAVSSATNRPIRRIYWTERGFNSPIVNIPAGQVEVINPAYSTNFPATVASEYLPPGANLPDPASAPPPERRTLWFERSGGIGQLRAYNLEGRIFVEYLGAINPAAPDTHQFLGADIVEVSRVAPSINYTVELGEPLTPRDELGRNLPLDGSSEWLASPILNASPDAQPYYGTIVRADGRSVHYAERENDNPDRVVLYWLERADPAIYFSADRPALGIHWPRQRNNYVQTWPADLARYAHYTVGPTGSTSATGIQFPPGQLPQIVYQDDPTQTQATLDTNSQRLVVTLNNDGVNRALLKFTSNHDVWYVPLFTQSQTRASSIVVTNGGSGYTSAPTVVFPPGAEGAAATATVSGGRVTGVTLTSPPTNTFTPYLLVSFSGGGGSGASATLIDPGFQESAGAAINTTVHVGQRVQAPVGYEIGGYIPNLPNTDCYLPAAYIDPFTLGVDEAAKGAIIPVNAIPGRNTFQVWWFKRIAPPSTAFQSFNVPAKIGRYTVQYPAAPPTIVLASNAGSGDLAADEAAGSLYVQNDATQPGFNPNEEHAVMLAGRVYALRDDLNITSGASYTSEPFALLHYRLAADGRPAMRVFRVVRELDLAGTANDVLFNYPVTAGTMIAPPMPLPLLPLAVDANGTVKNAEVTGGSNSTDIPPYGPEHYSRFTFKDRKGFDWVYRGPHASGAPFLRMHFYYPMRDGFFVPGRSVAAGTPLPYLRSLVNPGDPVTGTPLPITYRPVWPTSAPELRVAETLTLAKFGLPDVLSQSSAHVLYQQSIATGGTAATSVTLHDPFREKTYLFGAGGLESLPSAILTSTYQGKTYFQRLPPHLQRRVFFDPSRGTKGALVLVGQFVDEPAGEDYVHLNTLSPAEVTLLHGLVPASDPLAGAWQTAINNLSTTIRVFQPDPTKAGAYLPNGPSTTFNTGSLPVVDHADAAIVDYALTATGTGSGYVTLLFGNGGAFTPQSDPVALKIIKVVPRLYRGELKVLPSANPLDEQVTLRHTGDFAARPERYEFEWRYAAPVHGSAPATYTQSTAAWTSGNWQLARNPTTPLPAAAQYSGPNTLPLTTAIHDQPPTGSLPGLVLKPTNILNFTTGVPSRILFSATLGDRDGFVIYVNGMAALAYQAPAGFTSTAATSGLVPPGVTPGGLARQFEIDPNFFAQAINTVELALFSSADVGTATTLDFRIHLVTATDQVAVANSPWQAVPGTLPPQVIVGGSPTSPLGSPLVLMADNYFTMRYRPVGTNVAGSAWSEWMPPKLVEGWIKRVLAAINPFNQRMRDLYNNAVNTDVSLLTQAGKRWEGDIALTLENIGDFGLIEIYETLLNRARSLTVESGYDYAPANDALLLAAGYLADLYTLAGNEAFADAANPTISVDDSSAVTEVNTSRFSFEGQVKTVLEEELALLRGRDDFLATSITVAPAYNRLYWNYTRGINSGEALYAVNYNIREKAGSPTANGVLDAADAQRMFPQGHGDAYGHYLTAAKGYYRLLRHPHFTWTPRAESVTVLGQEVQVDYFEERKFAAAALGVARTAQQIVALTHRQLYKDVESAGWSHYRDGAYNNQTGRRRDWGLDEWSARAGQGAYLHWAVANAILPEVDDQPTHSGIQVIDRRTVPELSELAVLGADFQTRMDNANARLNPLGLSPGAIAFDISAADLKSGKSHYEQIHERSLRAVLNAKGAFDQAARMTRLLRNQENQVSQANDAIVDQERAFTRQLIEIYGTPYPGEIGPGKIYAQGYSGPDLHAWFIVDRPSELVDTTPALTLSVKVPSGVDTFKGDNVEEFERAYAENMATRTLTIQQSQFVQFSDIWTKGTPMGTRAVTGRLQHALLDVHQAHIALQSANTTLLAKHATFNRRLSLYKEMVATHTQTLQRQDSGNAKITELRIVSAGLSATGAGLMKISEGLQNTSLAFSEFPPKTNGLSNDVTSTIRGSIKVAGTIKSYTVGFLGLAATAAARYFDVQAAGEQRAMERAVKDLGFTYEKAQAAYEYEVLLHDLLDGHFAIADLATTLQRATEQLRNLLAEGDRLQAEREIFRQRAAALVQGYRTRDLTFRTFRNEALEQYRSLFDLAARYTYLAAKSYDYETGLLGTPAGQTVINGIVASRALGDLAGGVPQATISTLGDAGLAGTMARLQSDWSVAKGRLGINNPDTNGTVFSLRRELFRILDDPASTDDDAQWQQTLEQHIVSNLLADPDVAALCRNLRKPDGSAVPGIVLPFRTTIEHGLNFFGLPYASGDHNFTPSNFATKIYSVGTVFRGYIGMDPYAIQQTTAGPPNSTAPNALGATPYVYLIPVGTDYMLAPPLGDTGAVRAFNVRDQALPLPFNLGATQFSSTQFYNANGTLTEQPWILRKHQSFRAVPDPAFFFSTIPAEFTNSRLVGRSVWNSGWKLVIPAYALLNNEQEGLSRFVASVKDIELFLRTYSHSGN
jgi:hypothetical protein